MATYVKNLIQEEEVPETVVKETNKTESSEKMVGSIPENSRLEWSPIPFESFGKTTRIHSDELARKIRAAFGETFHDLCGANVIYENNNFVVKLYFAYNLDPIPEGKIRNLISLTNTSPSDSSNMGLYQKMNVIQNRYDGKRYTINDETKLLLSDFMYGGRQANKPNSKSWNNPDPKHKRIVEIAEPISSYGNRNAERTIVSIQNDIDLRRVLQKLYGDDMVIKTQSGLDSDINSHAKALYEPRFVKYCANGTFIMNIEQFDKGAVEQFAIQENPQFQRIPNVIFYY